MSYFFELCHLLNERSKMYTAPSSDKLSEAGTKRVILNISVSKITRHKSYLFPSSFAGSSLRLRLRNKSETRYTKL
jgi:hypothetical protein